MQTISIDKFARISKTRNSRISVEDMDKIMNRKIFKEIKIKYVYKYLFWESPTELGKREE